MGIPIPDSWTWQTILDGMDTLFGQDLFRWLVLTGLLFAIWPLFYRLVRSAFRGPADASSNGYSSPYEDHDE